VSIVRSISDARNSIFDGNKSNPRAATSPLLRFERVADKRKLASPERDEEDQ
jgi:hypothetical protein